MEGDMTKGVFFMTPLTDDAVAEVTGLGMSAVFVAPENLDPDFGRRLAHDGLEIYLVKDVFQGEAWWTRYPDCRPVGRDGEPMEIAAGWYHGVCPTHPGVREELLQEFDRLLDYECVSGINLNFLRFPGYWEAARGRESLLEGCTCQRCRSLYGGEPVGPDWERWKAAQIAEFARQIVALRDGKPHRTPIGLHMVPWDDERYAGARPGALGQDLSLLNPLLDYYSPMCHFGLQDQPPTWVGDMARWTATATGKPVVPVVQAMEVSDNDFAIALPMATAAPSDGAIVFTWEFMKDQPGKRSTLTAAYSA